MIMLRQWSFPARHRREVCDDHGDSAQESPEGGGSLLDVVTTAAEEGEDGVVKRPL